MATGGLRLAFLVLTLLSPTAAAMEEPGRTCRLAPGSAALDPDPSCTYADARAGGRPGLLVQYGGTVGFAQVRAEGDADDACLSAHRKLAKTGEAQTSACQAYAPTAPPPPPSLAPPTLSGGLPAPPAAPGSPSAPVDAEATLAHLEASVHLDFEEGAPAHRIAASAATPLARAGVLLGPAAAGHAPPGLALPAGEPAREVEEAGPLRVAQVTPVGVAAGEAAPSGAGPRRDVALGDRALRAEPETHASSFLGALSEIRPEVLAAPWVFLAWLLYHRLTRRQVTENGTRSRVLDALAHGPATATEVSRALGLDRKTASYHLRLLENFGIVASRPAGRERRYAPVGTPAGDGLSPGARRVLAAVRASPGATLSSLARSLGISKGTVHHHVHRLRASGAVVSERAPRGLRLRPA